MNTSFRGGAVEPLPHVPRQAFEVEGVAALVHLFLAAEAVEELRPFPVSVGVAGSDNRETAVADMLEAVFNHRRTP